MNQIEQSGPIGTVSEVVTDAEIASTYRVMKQLRPSLEESRYVEQVKRQQDEHRYRLAALVHEGEVRSAAGYRLGESLAWGPYMYVYDLVTDAEGRSRGYGRQMLDWLLAEAAKAGCRQLHLDSGVQRHDAHRFYLAAKMRISCHHFELEVGE